jgi:hypothetical protein
VKGLIEELIVEEIHHKDKQSSFFEELLRIWFGENFTVRSIRERKEHIVKFIDCKQYVCRIFAQYLPDEESEIYEAYFKLRKDGKYVRTENVTTAGNVTTVRELKDYDMGEYAKYIGNLNRKIKSQYKILLDNFELYLKEKVEEEIFLEGLKDIPFADRIRMRSQRNTNVINYAPFMQTTTKKLKNRPKKTIDDFRKTITAMKKANVIYYVPIYVFYT